MPSSVARGKPYSRMSWARRAASASCSTERKDTPGPEVGRFRRGRLTPDEPYPSAHRLQARLGGHPHQRSLVTRECVERSLNFAIARKEHPTEHGGGPPLQAWDLGDAPASGNVCGSKITTLCQCLHVVGRALQQPAGQFQYSKGGRRMGPRKSSPQMMRWVSLVP